MVGIMALGILLLTLPMVLRAGGEPALARLVNVYSSTCDTSDSREAVLQAKAEAANRFTTSPPDANELQRYNLTVEQFDADKVSPHCFASNVE